MKVVRNQFYFNPKEIVVFMVRSGDPEHGYVINTGAKVSNYTHKQMQGCVRLGRERALVPGLLEQVGHEARALLPEVKR